MMEDDEDKIDLTALDPMRDSEHWNRLVVSITDRARTRVRAKRSVTGQLAAWARPTLAVAAALCLIVWLGALSQRDSAGEDAVELLSHWANGAELPATSNILEAFNGAGDGSR